MPKRLPEFFVIDLLISIEAVRYFSSETRDPISFVENEAVYNSVLRELEIIGEATNNLLKEPSFKNLVKPSWRDVVNFRNVISHEYFGLDYEEIFDIITCELPAFEQEIKDLALQIKDSVALQQALLATKEDLKKIRRVRSVKYLDSIEQWLFGKNRVEI